MVNELATGWRREERTESRASSSSPPPVMAKRSFCSHADTQRRTGLTHFHDRPTRVRQLHGRQRHSFDHLTSRAWSHLTPSLSLSLVIFPGRRDFRWACNPSSKMQALMCNGEEYCCMIRSCLRPCSSFVDALHINLAALHGTADGIGYTPNIKRSVETDDVVVATHG